MGQYTMHLKYSKARKILMWSLEGKSQLSPHEQLTWCWPIDFIDCIDCIDWLVHCLTLLTGGQWPIVRGFELGCIKCHCFKHVLNCTIHSLPKQGQIPCIELGIELHKKRTSNNIIIHFTMFANYFVVYPPPLSFVPYQIINFPTSHVPVKVSEARGCSSVLADGVAALPPWCQDLEQSQISV